MITAPQETDWPAGGLEAADNCPVCGSKERALLHAKLRDRIFFVAPGEWNMWRCAKCGSGWLDPRPNEATIGLAYGRYYTHSSVENAPAQSLLGRLRARLGNGYRNWRYGTKLEPASTAGRLAAVLFPPLRWSTDAAYRFLPKVTGHVPSVLDVGCGNGGFLEAARSAGWDGIGVEPDEAARRLAEERGFQVVGSLDDLAGHSDQFDAVTFSHVIEHVHDPRQALTQAFAFLKPGGMLFVDTPNVNAIGHSIYGRHWRGLEPPRHLVLFSKNALEGLLQEIGFRQTGFHPRPDALPFTASQSRRISASIDPYSPLDPPGKSWPTKMQKVRAISGQSAEFLTVTAWKPR